MGYKFLKKAVEARSIVDQFDHYNFHNRELLNLYPDLKIVYDNDVISYYSTSLNPEDNILNWVREDSSTYCYVYFMYAYKEVQLCCPTCDGKMKVNTNPGKIPFLIEDESSYAAPEKIFTWYSTVYEDILKEKNFNPKCLVEIQLQIISKLEERKKSNSRVDISYVTNSIKKLLPFT